MTGRDVTTGRGLRIALSANRMPPDPGRTFYPPSVLGYVEEQMAGWVSSTGALAYVVPPPNAQSAVGPADHAADLDGLVLTGGADVSPTTYGQEPVRARWAGDAVRDRFELDLVEAFLAAGKPVLGVCRGHQLLNVACGGTLWQDLATEAGIEREHRHQDDYHRNLHEVDVVPGGWLAGVYPDQPVLRVNTIHHQAVRGLGADVVVEARSSDDGVVEALRVDRPGVWARGVQWHPEFFALVPDAGLADATALLDDFLAEARRAR
jgi:putative glutamine amidotransferase